MPNNRLGTTLENLLGRRKPGGARIESEPDPADNDVLRVPVHEIQPNPSQPRSDFPEEQFQELVQSVKTHGIIQPVILRRLRTGFEIVAGERRWRAAKAAGLETIPAQIRNVDSAQAFELSIIENIQRQDLNPMEKARAYKRLMDTFELTQEIAAQRLGISRSAIANIVRLIELPGEIQDALARGTIANGHARALLAVPDIEDQLVLWRKIEKQGLSVRQVEQIINKRPAPSRRSRHHNAEETKPAHILDLEEKLRRVTGTKVTIRPTKSNAGQITIEYYSLDDFDRIVETVFNSTTKKAVPRVSNPRIFR
jgi:ParB family chromosome partitioning protein